MHLQQLLFYRLCFVSFFFLNFAFYALVLIFTLCDFCLRIKQGFLNVLTFSADKNCLYLSTFYFILTFLYFYSITIIIIMILFIITVVLISFVIFIIISSFSMHLASISPVSIILFYTFVYIKYF